MKITLEFDEHERELVKEIFALEEIRRTEQAVKNSKLLAELEASIQPKSERITLALEVPGLPLVTEGIPADETIIIEPVIDLKTMFGANQAPGEWNAATQSAITQARQDARAEAAADAITFPQASSAPSGSLAPHVVKIPPDLDRDGLPWDGRIHSSTKAKNQDGTWRNKRGVDKDLITKVTAEYKQLMAIPLNGDTRTLPLPIPPVPPALASTSLPLGHTAVVPPQYQHLVPPVPVAPPVASSAPPINNVGDLIVAITSRIAAKTLTQDQINAACAKVGVPAIPLLGARPDLIPVVVAELGLS